MYLHSNTATHMQPIPSAELEKVVGGNSCHVNTVSAATTVGAGFGFLVGGPIGAIAGAISAGGHALFISLFAC
jgi:hypothetical protein